MSDSIKHPMFGDGFYPLDDEALNIELENAETIMQNDMFGTFTFIAGYRSLDFSADRKTRIPFLCIKNHTKELPHLFLIKDEL